MSSPRVGAKNDKRKHPITPSLKLQTTIYPCESNLRCHTIIDFNYVELQKPPPPVLRSFLGSQAGKCWDLGGISSSKYRWDGRFPEGQRPKAIKNPQIDLFSTLETHVLIKIHHKSWPTGHRTGQPAAPVEMLAGLVLVVYGVKICFGVLFLDVKMAVLFVCFRDVCGSEFYCCDCFIC